MIYAYKFSSSGNQTTVYNIDINLKNTLFSGQAFRWEETDDGFFGIVAGKAVIAYKIENNMVLKNVDQDFFTSTMAHYFDLERDYKKIIDGFKLDETLQTSIAFAPGIRVLNQQPFEALISFIISANNNIKRIRTIVANLCHRFGEQKYYLNKTYYAFPTPEQLAEATVEDLKACGAGYRADYIAETAKKIAHGYSFKAIAHMNYADARTKLTELKGVGNKVADCVLLYALNFKEAFPMDVWVKRIVHQIYGFKSKKDADVLEFVENKFGKYAGIAQQFLFYYVKENKLR